MRLYRSGKHSVFGLLFGIIWQFAFAEGFLLIVKHFLSEDPEALAKYPYVRIAMYIFWAPFMIQNVLEYIKDWKADSARKRLAKMVDAPKTAAAKAAAKAARGAAAASAANAVAQNKALERERVERDRQNREWQKRTAEEQRKQNQATAKFCPHCGARIVAGAKFCPACGGKQ